MENQTNYIFLDTSAWLFLCGILFWKKLLAGACHYVSLHKASGPLPPGQEGGNLPATPPSRCQGLSTLAPCTLQEGSNIPADAPFLGGPGALPPGEPQGWGRHGQLQTLYSCTVYSCTVYRCTVYTCTVVQCTGVQCTCVQSTCVQCTV